MADPLPEQKEKLLHSINSLEAQRTVLGDDTVDTAIAVLQEKLLLLEEQATANKAPGEARRMVTILFIDLVGSTSMAEKLDPEEWRQVIVKLHAALEETIAKHNGSVAQYLGDGLLAFFGSRQANEQDPENAIRAALEAHSAVANLNWAEKMQIRAGIHTGLVVVGELGGPFHKEFTASGDAMNLAARLQSAAPPGATLISHDTYCYVRGVFDMTPRPPLSIKGKSEPVKTYLVRRAKPRPFRSKSRGVAGVVTRTIGRDTEIQALQKAYLRAYDGHGMVWAQLLGDPGVGKSRLLMDLTDWLDLREETVHLLRARAFPDDSNQPYALVRRMWFDRFQIADDTPLEQAEAKWVERFKEFYRGDDYEEAAHALGLLVGLPFENSPYIKTIRNEPIQVKGRALVVSRKLIMTVRQVLPVVVLLEDLQWVYSDSWEYLMEIFLGETEEQKPNGLFILGTARPEWQPHLDLTKLFNTSISTVDQNDQWAECISLDPLPNSDTRQLAQELLQRVVGIPESVLDLLVERSEGVPFFLEEVINWFIDREIIDIKCDPWMFHPEKLKTQPLPATLQHLFLTRLSMLSQTEQYALQCGAIFGRHFWAGGIEALGVASAREILNRLQNSGFVEIQHQSAFLDDTEWRFHHNMLQEVSYESVFKRERSRLHKVAADWLEQQARQAGRLDEVAGLLGYHSERAGELSAAADWYLLAGKRALNQGALREAKDFFTQALELLPPVDCERRWQAMLGCEDVLSIIREYDPWKATISALLELANSFDDENYLAEAYLRQASFGLTADQNLVPQASLKALEAARRSGNEAIEIKALSTISVIDLNRGDKQAAIEKIDESLRLSRCLGDEKILTYVLFRAAFCYSVFHDYSKTIPLYLESNELARQNGDRMQEAVGLGNLSGRYIELGLFKQARLLNEQSKKINEFLGNNQFKAYEMLRQGRINLFSGDLHNSLQQAEKGLHEISSTHDDNGKGFLSVLLGRVLLAMGDALGASARFLEASIKFRDNGILYNAYEATVYLYYSAVVQGQLERARDSIYEAWQYIKEHGCMGMSYPGMVYLACTEVFDVLGESDDYHEALELGHREIMEVADRINNPEWRQSFLENNPDNRAFLDKWEHNKL